MKKFEYKTLKTKEEGFWVGTVNTEHLEVYLNKLGLVGWELVSVIETNKHHGTTNEIILLFKREII
jgi:Domain of unknown function (DUF4177)